MDYELKTVPTQIEYTVDENRQYGQLPFGMLTHKFEETDMGDESDMYDDYARKTLTNWGPDKNLFEHEEARGGVDARKGRLGLQYYGHRGESDDPAHPEMYMGFMGPGWNDPRGVATDPDFKKLSEQYEARMRFVRFTPDGNESVTGGGRSEVKAIRDNKTAFKWARQAMKWFATQKDGRREGIRRNYEYKSDINKQVQVRGYGDLIKDWALNPQRRSVLISDKIVRDSKWFREDCDDQKYAVHTYGANRKRCHSTTEKKVAGYEGESQFSAQDMTKCYKAVGMLLSELVRAKHQQCSLDGDIEGSESAQSVARKHEALVGDLTEILRSISSDSYWGNTDVGMVLKSKTPDALEHMSRLVTMNHLLPANHYLNAELMYKSVQPGADMEAVRKSMITDSKAPDIRDAKTMIAKLASLPANVGKMREGIKIDLDTESTTTHNYRSAKQKRAKRESLYDVTGESANSQNRKQNHANYKVIDKNAQVSGMGFADNTYKDRHAKPLGGKYLRRDMDRDSREPDLSI